MRLLICDDHKVLVEGLAIALHDRGHTVVATATDPVEAVEAARVHQPDVCLLDLGFPDGDGMAAISRIRTLSPDTKVVILSGLLTPGLVADAIARGASGYVGKEQPIGVLVETLQKAHEGYLAVDPLVLQEALRHRSRHDNPLWMLQFLTRREWEVLRCITDGLSTEQMTAKLGVQRSTARTHVQNLLAKLGVHSRLQAVALMTAHASAETWPDHVRDRVVRNLS